MVVEEAERDDDDDDGVRSQLRGCEEGEGVVIFVNS